MVEMCGICGMCGFEDEALLKNMCSTISHRGPDEKGLFMDDGVSLGSQRLSIIDLKTGRQPICNEDESVWVVFNGEIYNFRKLKRQLEEGGHKFYTNSDTEVIPHLYEEFGEKFIQKMNGIFAFAIWDSMRKKLILARDRLGVKPLYYASIGEKFMFASEIKALLNYEEIERTVDDLAIDQFLTFRYIFGERTAFSEVRRLPPAHILTYTEGEIELKKYWDLRFEPTSEKNFPNRLRDLIEKSVKMRLMSDVPLGSFLSGGLDSSTVVALMSKFSDEPVRTFSIGFGEEDDELPYARMVSERFGTNHKERIVSAEDAVKALPKIIWHLDEPLADVAAIPTYLMSELAKKDVKVVLTGEGGDEAFGGYGRYKTILGRNFHHKIPGWIKPILGRILPGKYGKYVLTLRSPEKTHLWYYQIFTQDDKNELNQRPKNYSPEKTLTSYVTSNDNILNQIFYLDFKTWLPEELLMKVDKTTMANSLEARVPFLDHKLVEYSAKIPINLKIRGETEKYVLREAMKDVVPKEIVERKKKGFTAPKGKWIKGEFKEIIQQILSEKEVKRRGLFDYSKIERLLREPDKNGQRIMSLLFLELWYRTFIDRKEISNPLKLN